MASSLAPLDDGMSTTGISLNTQDLAHLLTTGKWARFIAIVSFISIGLSVLGLVFVGSSFASVGAASPLAFAPLIGGVWIVVLYAIIIGIQLYPTIKLFQFSNGIMDAVNSRNGVAASTAFAALKSLYKFLGILVIVFIAIYVLLIGGVLLGGAVI